METAIFNTLKAIFEEKDESKREQMKQESNAELAAHFSHPANLGDLQELAYDALNQAWADAMAEDIVPQLIEVKTVGLADVDYLEEDLRGMRAYWQGKGGQILSDILRYERAVMPREEMVWAVDLHWDELRTNFWGTLDKLTSHAEEKLRQLPTTRLVELIQAAIASGVDTYGEFAATTLTDDQVDSVLDRVAANSGGQVSIVGTHIAARYLSRVGMEFGDDVRQQLFQTGLIGVYKGYPVAQVENFEDFNGRWVLPHNELWLVGRRAGRLTFYGAEAKVQTLPQPSFFTRTESARDAGMLLYGADKGRVGRIRLV